MELKSVVPWGRSLDEYQSMFALTPGDLKKMILGCGDGPASFNAELTSHGGSVVSADPVYHFTAGELRSRISEVYDEIMPKMEASKSQYCWDSVPSVEALGKLRMAAMTRFLEDYEQGKREGRYVMASVPDLPFADQQFDLALCSHFLFLYSAQVDQAQHLMALKELLRVAREVRVYPLVTLQGDQSPHLAPITDTLTHAGFIVEQVPSEYRFQKGATHYLVIRQSGYDRD